MAAELTTHRSMDGQWGFRIGAEDGRTLASGDGYPTVGDMRIGVAEAAAVLGLSMEDLERRDAGAPSMWSEHVD